MTRLTLAGWTTFLLTACGGQPDAPPAPPSEPAPAPPAVQPAPAAPEGPNPCATPAALTLELEAGIPLKTPFGLEMTYAIEEDKQRGPGYVFLLRSGTRRWETRRNDSNWTAKQTWRGFCWRGAARPEPRASKLQIQLAPVCKDGQLVEVGGCGDALN